MEGVESESLSSCFICGVNFMVKESPLRRRSDSLKNLRELVSRLCELLNVEVRPEEWEDLMGEVISCEKCFDILKNVERVHELLLKTQRELKLYLDEVEALIIRSESPTLQRSFWRRSCFKLRESVLKKVIPTITIRASENSIQIQAKEEYCGSEGVQSYHEDHFDNHSNDDNCGGPCSPLPIQYDFIDESVDGVDFQTTPFTTDAVPSLSSLLTTRRKTKKRKITVIAEEDEMAEVINNYPSISNPPPNKTGRARGAKKIAEAALQLYASSGEASDNDEEYKQNVDIPPSQTDSSDGDASADSKEESHVNRKRTQTGSPNAHKDKSSPEKRITRTVTEGGVKEKTHKPKSWNLGKKLNRIKVDNAQWRHFLYVNDDLYLYRWDSYVLNTHSHLECQAYECGFKTEFDFYPSFQRMRVHMEQNHRGKRHYQQTPHPCTLCKTIYKNREDFAKHFRETHAENTKKTRSVCECCLMICKSSNILTHMFLHKNEDEKADAIAKKEVPPQCLQRHQKEITTEKKYFCPYENCSYASNKLIYFKSHKKSHLPKDQRSDYTICPECGIQILKVSLNSHTQRLHHPETIDRYIHCKYCDMRYPYNQKYRYEVHLRKHSGERPFLCTECGKAYSDPAVLRHHMKGHQPDSQELPCEWCDMVYTNKTSLRSHWKNKHPDKWQPQMGTRKMSKWYYKEEEEVKGVVYGPKQMFPCSLCDTICTQRSGRKMHMFKIHGIGDLKERKTRNRLGIGGGRRVLVLGRRMRADNCQVTG